MNNIKLVKLLTGEDIIATILPSTDKVVVMKNPVRIVIMNEKAGFVKWAELSPDTEFTLDKFHVVAVMSVHKQLLEQYMRMTSQIIPATVSSLVMP